MLNKGFYRAFEDSFRGSRIDIKSRLEVYIPFVLPLKELYPNMETLDIGCGRGEWLELLKEHDIQAQGIDFDEGMLQACRERDLNAIQGDGIAYLKQQKSESTIIISAFHMIEHIPFEELQIFISEALRVLKPGGLLILETPNPENIKVSTENFYLDPTHTRPIPSPLLAFMTTYYGFHRTKVLRLQEKEGISTQTFIRLSQVIEDVSPDYAIVAQKDASPEILAVVDNIFAKEFGLSLSQLEEKFEMRLVHFEKQINATTITANKAIDKSNSAMDHYHTVINSTSWKITKPLRLTAKGIKWLISRFTS